MKTAPPKILAFTKKEANELLKRVQEKTATIEERQQIMTILKSYRELLDFVDKNGDNHRHYKWEVDHGWRKNKSQKQ